MIFYKIDESHLHIKIPSPEVIYDLMRELDSFIIIEKWR